MIILDTNVLSELLRPEPARQVEQWLSGQDGAQVYFTTVGEAELRHGVPRAVRSASLTARSPRLPAPERPPWQPATRATTRTAVSI